MRLAGNMSVLPPVSTSYEKFRQNGDNLCDCGDRVRGPLGVDDDRINPGLNLLEVVERGPNALGQQCILAVRISQLGLYGPDDLFVHGAYRFEDRRFLADVVASFERV